MTTATATTIKDEARKLIDRLPDDATWEDLQYAVYFRQAVDAGIADLDAGRSMTLAEARRRFAEGRA